ncbi:hypothetical protein EDB86DRAFT_3091226 [Lactarius hatsudake]|nr:hypothetical protein EDB86DRAFT_3091226 [Lactarius hatsudake]
MRTERRHADRWADRWETSGYVSIRNVWEPISTPLDSDWNCGQARLAAQLKHEAANLTARPAIAFQFIQAFHAILFLVTLPSDVANKKAEQSAKLELAAWFLAWLAAQRGSAAMPPKVDRLSGNQFQ